MSTLCVNEELAQSTEVALTYRIARTVEDRRGAFALVYQSYLRAGLGQANDLELRVTPFQLCPTSQIFVGVVREDVVSTVTLVRDGELGLPMESMFRSEIDTLRAQGRNVAEVSCLADRRKDPRRFLGAFLELTRLMAQFARYGGIENLLVSVHPRHSRFYTRYLGFEPISDRVASCPHVRDRPAVALNLDFRHIDVKRPRCYDDYFGTWVPRDELRPYSIPQAELTFLQHAAQICTAESEVPADASPLKAQGRSACEPPHVLQYVA